MVSVAEYIALSVSGINSLLIMVRLFLMIMVPGSLKYYIGMLFINQLLCILCLVINYVFCEGAYQMQPECVVTWIGFTVTAQWVLASLAILSFLNYYILETNHINFSQELIKARTQFLVFTILMPTMTAFLNFFNNDQLYILAEPPQTQFQIIAIFAPIFTTVIVYLTFTLLTFKSIRRQNNTQFFRDFKCALNTQIILVVPIYVLFLITIITAQFSDGLLLVYRITLLLLECLTIPFMLVYGVNSYVDQLSVYKRSNLEGLRDSGISDSDKTASRGMTTVTIDLSVLNTTNCNSRNVEPHKSESLSLQQKLNSNYKSENAVQKHGLSRTKSEIN